MKKNRNRFVRRSTCCLLSVGLASSLLQMPVLAVESADLVNQADQYTFTVPSEENGRPAENLYDGDDTTLWIASSGTWPSTVSITPPVEMPTIYKAVFKFEKGFPARSLDLKVEHIVNNVTDQPVVDVTQEDYGLGENLVVEWPDGINPTELRFTMSDPKLDGAAGLFWPGLAEIEIYNKKNVEEPGGALANIASQGTISSITPGQGVPSNLVDEAYNSLYVFSKGLSTTNGQAWVQIDYESAKKVKEVEVAFENLGTNDSNGFVFTYDILGKLKGESELTVLAADQSATRLSDNCVKTVAFDEVKELESVRVLIKSIANTGGDPWPALAELKILSPEEGGGEITDNILAGKTVHTNTNQANVARIVDGSLNTVWSGEMYPAYIDIDLGANYNLSDAVVYTPTGGYQQYSIYTSMDGVDFDRVARKQTKDSATAEGETWQLENKEARIVRLYMEYNSAAATSQVREFVVHGTPSGTEVIPTPAVQVTDFEDTDYAKPVTNDETYAEVFGIVERQLGAQYKDWFTLELQEAENGYDYYDVQARDGKVHITGNNGVSLATGLNAYLKNVCNVHISQVASQVKMPEQIKLPEQALHKETRFPVRYSYNFCTLSYSMAFWGEQEWRNELDWLALNGVNVVLDATGEEEVWRRFLTECGYSHQEIKDFIAGPAYYAWFYMANLTGMGGPIPDQWFAQRTELARKNHRIMQAFGMQPVLQGFCGMVPTDFTSKQPDAKVIPQGKWCDFQRPYMLKTDDASTFDKYADMFYQAQQEVYGDVTDYYATDPFHEGGNVGNMNTSTIASRTLEAMMKNDPDAVWVIQAWQGNPSNGLLAGLEGKREHALVLDLYAERTPHWNATSGYGGGEFGNTPWVYCMLNNFGGRLGLYGHLKNMNQNIPLAANTSSHMAGIGITPEASQNNPLLYEFIFDTIWTDDASQDLEVIDLDSWLEAYATRRYGAQSENANEVMKILRDTVYNGGEHDAKYSNGQGAPESIVNARPSFTIGAASTWGWSAIRYSKKELERALELLLADWDQLKDSPAYRYDVVSVAQQVASNSAQEILSQMSSAYSSGNLEEFTAWSDRMIELIEDSDDLLSTQKYFLLGTWSEAAGRLVSNPDDFTSDLFDMNAKALITTWGSINQCNTGGLKDYSNRQWAGLTRDVYLKRWQMFIAERKKALSGESAKNFSANDWFELEWQWARDNETHYTETPSDFDIEELAQGILEKYSMKIVGDEPDESRDLDRTKMTAKAGSQSASTGNEGPASNVLDDNDATIWHTDWSGSNGTDRENCWIELDLETPALVDGLRYKPRPSGINGIITSYQIQIWDETAETPAWKTVSQGSWAQSQSWKQARFDAVKTSKVRLFAVESGCDQNPKKNFASASEIRLTGVWAEQPQPAELNLSLLQTAWTKADRLALNEFKTEAQSVFTAARAAAKALLNDHSNATQSQIDQAASDLNAKMLALRMIPDSSRLN